METNPNQPANDEPVATVEPSPAPAPAAPVPEKPEFNLRAPHFIRQTELTENGELKIIRVYPPQDREAQPGEKFPAALETYRAVDGRIIMAEVTMGTFTPPMNVEAKLEFPS